VAQSNVVVIDHRFTVRQPDTFPTTAACNDDVLSDTKRAAAQRGTNHTSPQLCVCNNNNNKKRQFIRRRNMA